MKRVKLLLLIAIAMLLSISLAGCGGDKFAGKWVMQNGNQMGDILELGCVEIVKNGENYIVTINSEELSFLELNSKYYRAAVEKTDISNNGIEITWKKRMHGPYPAIVMGNVITCDLGAFAGKMTIMHVEKDDSLMMQGHGGDGVILKKYNEKEYESLRREKEDGFLSEFAKRKPEVYVKIKGRQSK